MTNITIIGAGVHGSRMADKYRKFPSVHLKAVICPQRPRSEVFEGVPYFVSAESWKNHFGKPKKDDVFDLCVHNQILVQVLSELVSIGAKNFVLPKPVALKKNDLIILGKIILENKLNVVVASQWSYSALTKELTAFIKANKKNISSVEVVFSRSFTSSRKNSFSALTAFLSHIIQILFDMRLINKKYTPVIEGFTGDGLVYKYSGKIPVHVKTSISEVDNEESVRIFLENKKKPAFIADFSGIIGKNGFIKFPSFLEKGKKTEVREDVLEKMIGETLGYFSGDKENVLTFEKYKPVAEEVVRISELANNLVVVIGGGIFGTLSALEIAKKGYSVIMLEKSARLVTGASLVNQCRVHMGYHYPRDEETARDSRHAKNIFEKIFSKAIVKDVQNHYLVSKEGSLTSSRDFKAFCKKLDLPYKELWPEGAEVSKDKIALSLRVPEKIFDANVIRNILEQKITETHGVTLLTGANVVGVEKIVNGYEVRFIYRGEKKTILAAALVNAA